MRLGRNSPVQHVSGHLDYVHLVSHSGTRLVASIGHPAAATPCRQNCQDVSSTKAVGARIVGARVPSVRDRDESELKDSYKTLAADWIAIHK